MNYLIPDEDRIKHSYDAYFKTDIPLDFENIIARIEFPNGVSDYLPSSGAPIPVAWRKGEFFEHISELSSFHITRENREKLLSLKD